MPSPLLPNTALTAWLPAGLPDGKRRTFRGRRSPWGSESPTPACLWLYGGSSSCSFSRSFGRCRCRTPALILLHLALCSSAPECSQEIL